MEKEKIELRFRHTEEEYLAAVRLYVLRSPGTLAHLVTCFILLAACLIALLLIGGVAIPLSWMVGGSLLAGVALFHYIFAELPRRRFRGDPKFRDEYALTFSDEGIEFRTRHVNAQLAWSLYTEVLENESFYLLIYGKNIASISVVPKRAFQSKKQEAAFREMLRLHIDHNFSRQISEAPTQEIEYVPSSYEPPDWR